MYSPHLEPIPGTLYELLKLWDGELMWSGLDMPDDPSWIIQAMANGTLVGITDGSYDRRKTVSGAG